MLTCTFKSYKTPGKQANLGSDARAPPQKIVEQVLAIAPILPGQKNVQKQQEQKSAPKQQEQVRTQPPRISNAQPQPRAHEPPANLIDLDSRPSSVAPSENASNPIAGNPLHPTSNPKQIAPVHESTTVAAPVGNQQRSGNLMDDDHHLNDKMANMSMQQPLRPSERRPIKRTDTETSDLDEFVDAEG